MTVGKRIRERRNELHMSVDELAKRLNKNRATVYRYEKGEIENLPIDVLEPLAKALDTTPQYFPHLHLHNHRIFPSFVFSYGYNTVKSP